MNYLRICLLFFLVTACTQEKEKIPPLPIADEPERKLVIYQVMTRLFGNTNTTNKTYGTLQENGVGKFTDISNAALAGIKGLGATHIWYTGVLEHATQSDYTAHGIPLDDADVVKGLAGSPYAIKDYYDVNPDLATVVSERMEEFEQLINRTHANELKVIIDFVPNHVARLYHSDVKPDGVEDFGVKDDTTKAFHPNNNFYYLIGEAFKVPRGIEAGAGGPTRDGKFMERPAKATGNNVFTASPGIDDWYETVKLNYGVDLQEENTPHVDQIPSTWNKMKDILLFWTSKGVDGFRCDMAEMVPVEFWNWAIPQIKEVNPAIIFIAEIYNPNEYKNYISNGQFDFLYDKVQLYDTLRLLTSGKGSTEFIAPIQNRLATMNANMLHFLENHDEQRVASKYFAGDMWKAAPAMTISATIDKGPVMIYFGQEVGERGEGNEGFQGEDGRTTIFDYWGVPAHQAWMNNGKFDGALLTQEQKQLRIFYRDILTLASKSQAVVSGDFIDLTAYNIEKGNFSNQIHAFVRYTDKEKLLIVSGFNNQTEEVRIEIPKVASTQMGLDTDEAYIARDLIWKELEVGFDQNFSFTLKMKPYSCFIFKIK